jgi:F-type H+-transporting ATPase subunit b
MLFLAEFSVLNPSYGLFIWTTLIFILVWVFLSRFFKNIAQALEDRENFIDGSISKAKEAESALAGIESQKDLKIKEAEKKSLEILREAEAIKKKKIAEGEAQGKTREENILKAAEQEKENRLKEMEVNIQNSIGQTSIEIAKGILDGELKGNHEAYIRSQIEKMNKGELIAG